MTGLEAVAGAATKVPGSHGDAEIQLAWFLLDWNVPRGHSPHSRSDVVVGSAETKVPGQHVEWGRQELFQEWNSAVHSEQ